MDFQGSDNKNTNITSGESTNDPIKKNAARRPQTTGVKRAVKPAADSRAKMDMAARARMIMGGQKLNEIAESITGEYVPDPVAKLQEETLTAVGSRPQLISVVNDDVQANAVTSVPVVDMPVAEPSVEPAGELSEAEYNEHDGAYIEAVEDEAEKTVDEISDEVVEETVEESVNEVAEDAANEAAGEFADYASEEIISDAASDVPEEVEQDTDIVEAEETPRESRSGSIAPEYDIFSLDDGYDTDDMVEVAEGVYETRFKNFCRKNVVENGVLKRSRKEAFDIDIPNGVTAVGMRAFNADKHLTRVVMARSVARIEKEAFWNCQYLKHVHFSNALESIGEAAFWGCYAIEELELPESLMRIGKQAFKYCEHIKSVNIPSKVRKISEGAFHGCCNLASVSLPRGLETIEAYAFCECKSLMNISIPEGVSKISDAAFMGCVSLKEIYIPKSVKYIGKGIFDGCGNLKKVTLHKGAEIPEAFVEKNVTVEYI